LSLGDFCDGFVSATYIRWKLEDYAIKLVRYQAGDKTVLCMAYLLTAHACVYTATVRIIICR